MHSNASNVLFLIPIKYQRYQMIPKNMIPNRINTVFLFIKPIHALFNSIHENS
nr:MAG TPA: hypothetical protein [Caudoviricetes sp.]